MICSGRAHSIQGQLDLEIEATEAMDDDKIHTFPVDAGLFHTQTLTFNPKPKPSSAAASVALAAAHSDSMAVDADTPPLTASCVKQSNTRDLSRSPPNNRQDPKLGKRVQQRAKNKQTFTLHDALVMNNNPSRGSYIRIPSAVLPVEGGLHAAELFDAVTAKTRKAGRGLGMASFVIGWSSAGYFIKFENTAAGWGMCKDVHYELDGVDFKGASLDLELFRSRDLPPSRRQRKRKSRNRLTLEPVVDAGVKIEDEDVMVTIEADPSGDMAIEDFNYE